MEFKLRFKKEKETPGTIRYREVDSNNEAADPIVVGQLYIRKAALKGTFPELISMVLTSE